MLALNVSLIGVDRLAKGLLDFNVATVRELRGVDPGLLANVEVMPILHRVDGVLDFLGDLDKEARVRYTRVGLLDVGGSGRTRNASNFPGVGERGVSPSSSGGKDEEKVLLRILEVLESKKKS